MKKGWIWGLMALLMCTGQGLKAQDLYAGFIQNNDPRFQDLQVPEKWKGESAVVLNSVTHYQYKDAPGKAFAFSAERRKQVKLLSRAAIDVFSRFYFSERDKVGFVVIKPDGTRKEIPTSSAIGMGGEESLSDVPEFYRRKKKVSEEEEVEYQKLAIPFLQPGDIIDFYLSERDTFVTRSKFKTLVPPVFELLSNVYPVRKNTIEIDYDPIFLPVPYSANDAPKAKESTGRLVLSDQDRDAYESERWNLEGRSFPYFIMPMHFKGKSKKVPITDFIISEKTGPKGEAPMTRDQIFRYQASQFVKEKTSVASTITARCNMVARNACKSNKTDLCYAQACYEYLQHTLIRAWDYQSSSMINIDDDIFNRNGVPQDDAFFRTMLYMLDQKNIPYEIVAAIPRAFGTLEQVISVDVLDWGIRLPGKTPIYIFTPDEYTPWGEIPARHEACPVLVSEGENQKSATGPVGHFTVPQAGSKQSILEEIMEVSIRPEMDSLDVTRVSLATGAAKVYYSDRLVLTSEGPQQLSKRYREIDKSVKTIARYENSSYGSSNTRVERLNYFRTVKERKEGDYRESLVKRWLYDEFNDCEFGAFILSEPALNKRQPMKWEENFVMGSRLKKGGDNFIFELGHLLGGQVEVYERDKERKFDIFMNYPRQYKKTVRLDVPAGYVVEGLDNLNFKVENETGSFVSSARLEDGEIVFESLKTYHHNYEPKENWPKMIDFLDAAYDCTRTKILLRKQ